MQQERELSEPIKNALSELGNIGAGNAATSLSMMLASKLTMTPPKVIELPFDSLVQSLGGEEANVVAILSEVTGELTALIMFVMGFDEAKALDSKLLGDEVDWHSEMGLSAVKEIGNIIIGTYVGSLETLIGNKLRYGMPEIMIDMAGTILSIPCIEFGADSDNIVLIDSDFQVDGQSIDGHIMVFSISDNFNDMLHKLGVE